VAANAVSSTSGKSSSDLGRWEVVSDTTQETSTTDGSNSGASPPSFMPNPVSASSMDRYAGHGASQQAYDPFQRQTVQTDVYQTAPDPYARTGRYDTPRQSGGTAGSASEPNPLRYRGSGSSHANPYVRTDTARQRTSAYGGTSRDIYQSAPVSPKVTRSYNSQESDFSDPYDSPPARKPGGTYVVQPNDSYWLISKSHYGSGAYFKALAEHNRPKHPDADRLRVGDSILVPDQSELEQTYPDLCPDPSRRKAVRRRASLVSARQQFSGGRTYTVEAGDTLFGIARFELGKGSRWVEIYKLNQDVLQDDFDYLTPGMQLILPEDSGDSVTRRPDAPVYQR
jgi:nucleoid-associated protein YgaU